ncbi:hypothetical protein [Pseudacidovorax intermedius]|uniref:hypothetical protein n=1 Tax=Pseudacidovorax intermedius TaxID=433924 RepID=UPI0026EFBBD3|nr:hypothetical protein [Pseudacidovorax intermedius]
MAQLPPDVLTALEQAVKECGSQVAAAKRLGVSVSAVNQLLRNRYQGDVAGMAERVRGEFMRELVRCPVMGDLGRQHCLEYQGRPLVMSSPVRVALHRACPTCPNKRRST